MVRKGLVVEEVRAREVGEDERGWMVPKRVRRESSVRTGVV